MIDAVEGEKVRYAALGDITCMVAVVDLSLRHDGTNSGQSKGHCPHENPPLSSSAGSGYITNVCG